MIITGSGNPNTEKLDYTDTHRDIVEACMSGNRQAQFELYRLYGKAMYNICLRMLHNEADAEDVLQNSFVDVFGKLDSFRFQSSIGAWIKRIVINNCINFLKRRRILTEEWDAQYHDREEPEPEMPVGLTVEAVRDALYELPDGYRVVFSLYAMEGYDHKEIAQIMDITEATSKSQYSRARRRLKEVLSAKRKTSNY